MKKFLSTAVVAATAITALSACTADTTGSSSGTNHAVSTSSSRSAKAGKSRKPAPSYTAAQQNAIRSAQDYLSMGSGFSRAGLIGQLSSKAGEGFKMADAVFAVDHIKVDYNKQALMSAKAYLRMSGFSRAGLMDQLTSKAGDQYTAAQATYAVNHVGL